MSFQHSYCQCETCKRQERQAFIDEAARGLFEVDYAAWLASEAGGHFDVERAVHDVYAYAEALWSECQRRKEGDSDG